MDLLADFAVALSPFNYVNNNPLNLIDIGGLFPNEFGQGSKQEEEETYPFTIPGPPIIVEAEAPSFLPFWLWIYNPSLRSYFYQRVKGTFNANWAVNIFGPKATQSDPWWWRVFRGTGDLEQDVQSFFYGAWGITFAGIGIAVTSTILPAATTTVGNWGIAGWNTFQNGYVWVSNTGLYAIQRGYAWVNSLGDFVWVCVCFKVLDDNFRGYSCSL